LTSFSLELLQAVSDWQKGGDTIKKGERLKNSIPADLPKKFRTCFMSCYRQEAHAKERIWQLIADNHLPERIAAWTLDLTVAKAFKGGVPPLDLHGVIFKIVPPTGSVILNLTELYRDADFLAALQKCRDKIVGWHEGAGRYQDTQQEVILELESLDCAIDNVVSLGGFIGSVEQIAQELYGRDPSSAELKQVSNELTSLTPRGDWWLTETGTRAVLERVKPHLKRLREKKRRQEEQ